MDFTLVRNKHLFLKKDDEKLEAAYAALGVMSGEINRMAKSGFNTQEFRSTVENHYRAVESVYDTRFSQPNARFMGRAMDHYFGGFSLASIEMHFTIMKDILYSGLVKTEQLNNYAAALLGQKEGVVISCRMPQAEGVEELSVARIQNAFVNSLSKTDYIASVDKQVSWPKFVVGERQSSLVSETTDPVTGAVVFELSNGIKVVFKQMDGLSDTVSFGAISKGGLSAERTKYGRDMNLYIGDIANLSAIGGYSRAVWDKLFSYNNISVSVDINDYMEEMKGYCTVESLEKLMHYINMSFTRRESDYNAFDVYRKGKIFEAKYRKLSPAKVFEDSARYYNSGNKRYLPSYSPEFLEKMDYHKVHATIGNRLGNPADFVYVFAGNVSVDKMRENIVKYLGTLSASHDAEEWIVNPNYAAKGKVEKRFLHHMILPRAYVDVTLSCGMQNTQSNKVLSGLLEEYLRSFCARGAVKEFSPKNSVSAGIEIYPEEIMICRQRFETDSAGAQRVIDLVDARLQEVSYNGIPDEEFAAIKKGYMAKISMQMQNSKFWVDSYIEGCLQGKDLYSGILAAVEGITAKDFKNFVEKISRRGNRIVVVLEGTTEDVNTQNLFRENQFIREYFDL